MRADENGLPIHGALAAAEDWDVVDAGADDQPPGWRPRSTTAAATTGSRSSRSRTGSSWSSAGRRRAHVTTTVEAGDDEVPLAFGWHPWLSCRACRAREWELAQPAREAIALDERELPTGERSRRGRAWPLGDRVLDHCVVAEDARFALSGGGREIAVEWAGGYRYAQVFAPTTLDVVCLEPMMAPVAALSTGEELDYAAARRARRATGRVTGAPCG